MTTISRDSLLKGPKAESTEDKPGTTRLNTTNKVENQQNSQQGKIKKRKREKGDSKFTAPPLL